jgi:3-oxoacyl-[acyl-carrier-protein] synthase I
VSAIRITAVGALTSIGTSAVQTDASLRAGLCRFHASPWAPEHGTISLARVHDDALAETVAKLRDDEARRRTAPASEWTIRLLATAGLALADAVAAAEPDRPGRPERAPAAARPPIVLLLGLPDPREGTTPPEGPSLWTALSLASGIAIDPLRSLAFPRGRAAIFDTLAAARELLARDPEAQVICGGCDSYVDETRVRREHGQGRTLGGPYAGDGRPLGEAAGMLVVEPIGRHRGGLVVTGIGRVDDPGHRFGGAPARGEGLANAIEALRTDAEPPIPFGTVWAGLVGESFDGKQWGIACLRHRDRLLDSTIVEHPADRLGDAGAGLGALLFVDAHQRLIANRRAAPALLWAISDHGPIGAASVELDPPGATR